MGRPILVTGPYATQLEQEVERRQRLGQESAARKALISKSYHPVRPDVYNTLQVAGRARSLEGGGGVPAWGPSASQLVCSAPQDETLAPEFLAAAEYSKSPGADFEGLLQRLETVSGEVLAPSPSRSRTGGWDTGVPPPCLPPKSKPAGARRAGGTDLPGAGRQYSLTHLRSTHSVPMSGVSQLAYSV